MKTVSTSNHHQTPLGTQIAYVVGITALLLMIPLVAMQFTSEVNWTLSDFIIGGGLIATVGMMYVGASRLVRTRRQRWMVGGGLFLLLAFIWVEMAVGLVGSPIAGS